MNNVRIVFLQTIVTSLCFKLHASRFMLSASRFPLNLFEKQFFIDHLSGKFEAIGVFLSMSLGETMLRITDMYRDFPIFHMMPFDLFIHFIGIMHAIRSDDEFSQC